MARSFKDHARFFKAFLRHPFSVGSIVPSSKFLAENMTGELALDQARLTLEVGPGTGAITEAILEKVQHEKFIGFELNPHMVKTLKERFPKAVFVNDTVENSEKWLATYNLPKADFVVSGIPWTLLNKNKQLKLLNAILNVLSDRGEFVTYSYIHSMWMPLNLHFKELLYTTFRSVHISKVVWKNFPPAIIFHAKRY